jgi:lactoylglutathione lyase
MQEHHQSESLSLQSVMPALTVNDLAASLAWYRDVLGFTVTQEMKNEDKLMGAMLKAGAVELLLGQDDFAKGRDRQKGVGMRLYWVTAQDVDTLAEAIVSRGGVLAHPPKDEPWGGRDFAVTDPDGFLITITTRPKE